MASIAYINLAEGTSIAVLNAMLVLAILSDKTLRQRKELLFVTGLAISDAMYGIGCMESGRDKLIHSVIGNITEYTALDCFFRTRELLVTYPSQVSQLIMIAISGERLVAVVWFQGYGTIQARSYLIILFFTFFIPLCTMFAAGIQAHLLTVSGKMFNASCSSYSEIFTFIVPVFKVALGFASVAIYALVFRAYKAKVGPLSEQTIMSTRKQRIRGLTHTLALITSFTLLFYCIPQIVVWILNSYEIFALNSVFWTLLPLQYIVHVVVFYWRQKEIRDGVLNLICCKAKFATANSSMANT